MKNNLLSTPIPNFSAIFNVNLKNIQGIINVNSFKSLHFNTLEFYTKQFSFIKRNTLEKDSNYSLQTPKWQGLPTHLALSITKASKVLSLIAIPLKANVVGLQLKQQVSPKQFKIQPFTIQYKQPHIGYKVFTNLNTFNFASFKTNSSTEKSLGIHHFIATKEIVIPLNNIPMVKFCLFNSILNNHDNIPHIYSFIKGLKGNWEQVLCKIGIFHNKTLTSLGMLIGLLVQNLQQDALDTLTNISFATNYTQKPIFNYPAKSWQSISKLNILNNKPVVSLGNTLKIAQHKLNPKTGYFTGLPPYNKLLKALQLLQQNVVIATSNKYSLIIQNFKFKEIKVLQNHKLFNKLSNNHYGSTTKLINRKANIWLPNPYHKAFVIIALQHLSKKIYKNFSKLVHLPFATLFKLNYSLRNITGFNKNINTKLWELPTTKVVNKSLHYNQNNTTKIVNNANVTVYNNGKQSVANDIVEATNKSFQQTRLASIYGK